MSWQATLKTTVEDDDEGRRHELIFVNQQDGATNSLLLFDCPSLFPNFPDTWRGFVEDFDTGADCRVVFSGLNGVSMIEVVGESVRFTVARCGYGGLDDFQMSFSVPKQSCVEVFRQLGQ